MSLAWCKTVLKSVTNHEQSAAESSTVMAQRRRSSVVRILPDYIVGPPNLRVLLTVNHVAAELLRLVGLRTSQSDTMELPGKAVTRGVFWVFEHPPKFQGKIRHTKQIYY